MLFFIFFGFELLVHNTPFSYPFNMFVSAVKDTEKEKTKMTQKYFAVTVKFGHVGQHKCIIKTVPMIAESGKDAA